MLGYLCVAVAVLSFVAADTRVSPCPQHFKYVDDGKEAGKLIGELTMQSEYVLHGVWARIIFDGPITAIKPENFGDALWFEDNPNEALIKNRDFLVKKNTPFSVRFHVDYKGDKAPNLLGFRLNGRTICPVGQD